jgi:hypothetical protein
LNSKESSPIGATTILTRGGLPDAPQAGDDKVQKFGEWLWAQRSIQGKTPLDLLNYVIWGSGPILCSPLERHSQ